MFHALREKHITLRSHPLREGLAAGGLAEADLAALKGSDPRKLALARLLWKRTTVSQEWLAQRLRMRSAANVSQQLRRLDEARNVKRLSPAMKTFLKAAETSA